MEVNSNSFLNKAIYVCSFFIYEIYVNILLTKMEYLTVILEHYDLISGCEAKPLTIISCTCSQVLNFSQNKYYFDAPIIRRDNRSSKS